MTSGCLQDMPNITTWHRDRAWPEFAMSVCSPHKHTSTLAIRGPWHLLCAALQLSPCRFYMLVSCTTLRLVLYMLLPFMVVNLCF